MSEGGQSNCGAEAGGGTLEGVVTALLPNAAYRVEAPGRRPIIAHAGPPSAVNFVRLRPRDRVLVKLSEHDPTRGRIVRLLEG